MPKNSHDVIVIGAGHNGLTCASYMAKAGLDVLVLAEPKMDIQGPILESFSNPSTNSDIILKTLQVFC